MHARTASRFGAPLVTLALVAALAAPALAQSETGATSAPAQGSRARTAPVAPKSERKPAAAAEEGADSSRVMKLKGGEEGTVFRTLTVQGEDRIHIEVERPTLKLGVDPERAPGLDRGSVGDVLDRTTPDLEAPLVAGTSRDESPWVAHPWLAHFPQGAVARFRPTVTHVERWKLVVVNARAESVAVFRGNGDPPREIAWDGRSSEGRAVLPGTSYSYVFEARDKAGNKRNFVGEGFRVSAFRYTTPQGPVLVFSGQELSRAGGAAYGADEAPPIVMEAVTAMNQEPATSEVRIEVRARSAEEANALGRRLVRWMSPFVIGDPSRLQTVALVQPDAPAGGAVELTAER